MEPVNKPSIIIKVDILPGPASPLQKATWRRFWIKLIADANNGEDEGETYVAKKGIKSDKGR
jgi:hypothetical protein